MQATPLDKHSCFINSNMFEFFEGPEVINVMLRCVCCFLPSVISVFKVHMYTGYFPVFLPLVPSLLLTLHLPSSVLVALPCFLCLPQSIGSQLALEFCQQFLIVSLVQFVFKSDFQFCLVGCFFPCCSVLFSSGSLCLHSYILFPN